MGIEDRVQQKMIDGFTYEVRPLQAGIGRKALLRFIKLAGPVIAAATESGKSMTEAATSALSVLSTTLDDKDVDYFVGLFGPHTRFCEEGQESGDRWAQLNVAAQEMHFSARYMAMFDWLKFSMEVNFGGFFGESIRRATEAADQAKTTAKV
jgi:hypothetical protein